MSNTQDNGGPAYPMPSGPEPRVNSTTHYNEGMTLLDHFAGLAMQSIVMRADVSVLTDRKDMISAGAYHIAVAMIAEKRRREGGTC